MLGVGEMIAGPFMGFIIDKFGSRVGVVVNLCTIILSGLVALV